VSRTTESEVVEVLPATSDSLRRRVLLPLLPSRVSDFENVLELHVVVCGDDTMPVLEMDTVSPDSHVPVSVKVLLICADATGEVVVKV
jgi:hypothetical protein